MSLKWSIFATLFISAYISEMMIDMNNTLTNKYSQLFSGAYTFNLSAFKQQTKLISSGILVPSMHYIFAFRLIQTKVFGFPDGL